MTPPTAGCGAWWLRIRNEMDVTALDPPSSLVSWGDVEGAVAVAEELVTMRAGPQVAAALEHHVLPRRESLEPVVTPAEPGDVARTGRATIGVRNHVVAVGAAGRPGAPGEHAGLAESR